MSKESFEDTSKGSLVRNSNTPAYKIPVVQKKPSVVLEEDDYVEAMQSIIKRDFFPQVEKLQKQCEYLDALANDQTDEARRIGVQLAKMTGRIHDKSLGGQTAHTPLFSPQVKDTPKYTNAAHVGSETPNYSPQFNSTDSSSPTTNINVNMSLDEFVSTYISEDTASFEKVLEIQEQERREKYKWIYDAEKKKLLLDNKPYTAIET
ncbi:DiGeorge syndrome critical region protein 14, partial [Nowakowskiella sp. JEL0078]